MTDAVKSASYTAESGFRGRATLAVKDVIAAFALSRLWLRLGWNDIVQRYRRSILGPFWLTASTGVMVVALGTLYAKLFNSTTSEFLPYLCVGLLIWTYLSSFFLESGTLFIGSESYIRQIRLPFSLYVLRSIWSKLIIFLHNFVIYFAVIAYFGIWPGPVALLSALGLIIVTLNGAAASLFIGMISARFRDIPQLINSVMQIIFFMTPIMWKPELLGTHAYLATWNPFYSLIEIVRAPLLGQQPGFINLAIAVVATAANMTIASLFFIRFRSRIPYWV
jgi:lipopolysaccharide transport system permease protein